MNKYIVAGLAIAAAFAAEAVVTTLEYEDRRAAEDRAAVSNEIKSATQALRLNDVAPNSENWLGVQGNAGRVIKILAQGAGSSPAGGVQVTASTMNNNNTTTYAYSGVAVKRNGVNEDYLYDKTSSNGIVRRSELASAAPGYAMVSNAAMNALAKTGGTMTGPLYFGTCGANIYSDECSSYLYDPANDQNASFADIITCAVGESTDYAKPADVVSATNELAQAIPTNVSELNNDAGYLTSYTETDPTVPSWAKGENKPSYSAREVKAIPYDYIDHDDIIHTTEFISFDNDVIFGNAATIWISTNFLYFGGVKYTGVSTFPNDAGYLTSYTETDPTVHDWAKAATKPTYTASEVGAATPSVVTNIVRDLSLGGIWDGELEVWWTPRMSNGSLVYEATTNVNLNAEN